MVGRIAVEYSRDPSKREGSVAMIRQSNSPYVVGTTFTSIKNVARETKHMDAAYIENGNNITQAFIDYAKPLVGPLPTVGTLAELLRK